MTASWVNNLAKLWKLTFFFPRSVADAYGDMFSTSSFVFHLDYK